VGGTVESVWRGSLRVVLRARDVTEGDLKVPPRAKAGDVEFSWVGTRREECTTKVSNVAQ